MSRLKQESLTIAQARFEGGTTSQRDVEQARTVLTSTQATIPVLQIQLRQAKDAISVLLGMPPNQLKELEKGNGKIPTPPTTVVAGIPAELLRRRPDIRAAEYNAIAQCAQIGVAKADLLPAFSLTGNFGTLSSDVGRNRLGDVVNWRNATHYLWTNRTVEYFKLWSDYQPWSGCRTPVSRSCSLITRIPS